VYAATKAFVHQFSQAMKSDLAGTGVRVTCVEPGMVETEFSVVRFQGDQTRANKVYEGMTPLSPADVADVIHFAVTRLGDTYAQRSSSRPRGLRVLRYPHGDAKSVRDRAILEARPPRTAPSEAHRAHRRARLYGRVVTAPARRWSTPRPHRSLECRTTLRRSICYDESRTSLFPQPESSTAERRVARAIRASVEAAPATEAASRGDTRTRRRSRIALAQK